MSCLKGSKEELENKLEKICISLALDSNMCGKIYDHAKEKYNIPRGMASDYICMRSSMSEANEFILFCLLDSIIDVVNIKLNLSDYYTELEIKEYSRAKYEIEKIKFPLKFKMIQITADQWVGKIDVAMLIKLREAQLINYNENAQRVLTKIIRGDKEIYKISLNQTAVASIKNSFERNSFIPNTITLNLAYGADFYYDNKTDELIINELKHFDASDGFHRIIAAYKAYDNDNEFNYPMELRIINFSDDKVNRFIYQEDQKTQMKKLDSKSFNMDNPANIVVERINESPRCNIKGCINRNKAIINYGELAELIRYFYFRNKEKIQNENMLVLSVTKDLIEKFNVLTEYDTKYMSEKYSYKKLAIIIYVFSHHEDLSNLGSIIEKMTQRENDLDNKRFSSKIPRKAMVNDLEKLFKDVMTDV